MDIIIRECVKDDAEGVLELIQSAFAEQKGIIDPPSSAESQTLEGLIESLKTASALVAEDNSSAIIVACVILTPINDSLYIGKLSVLPSRRKEGIGFQLMQAAEKKARQEDYRTISLAVRLVLKDQQRYYKRFGFEMVNLGTHEGYLEPTYMNMEKIL